MRPSLRLPAKDGGGKQTAPRLPSASFESMSDGKITPPQTRLVCIMLLYYTIFDLFRQDPRRMFCKKISIRLIFTNIFRRPCSPPALTARIHRPHSSPARKRIKERCPPPLCSRRGRPEFFHSFRFLSPKRSPTIFPPLPIIFRGPPLFNQ